jgi:hypothetical protein
LHGKKHLLQHHEFLALEIVHNFGKTKFMWPLCNW